MPTRRSALIAASWSLPAVTAAAAAPAHATSGGPTATLYSTPLRGLSTLNRFSPSAGGTAVNLTPVALDGTADSLISPSISVNRAGRVYGTSPWITAHAEGLWFSAMVNNFPDTGVTGVPTPDDRQDITVAFGKGTGNSSVPVVVKNVSITIAGIDNFQFSWMGGGSSENASDRVVMTKTNGSALNFSSLRSEAVDGSGTPASPWRAASSDVTSDEYAWGVELTTDDPTNRVVVSIPGPLSDFRISHHVVSPISSAVMTTPLACLFITDLQFEIA